MNNNASLCASGRRRRRRLDWYGLVVAAESKTKPKPNGRVTAGQNIRVSSSVTW